MKKVMVLFLFVSLLLWHGVSFAMPFDWTDFTADPVYPYVHNSGESGGGVEIIDSGRTAKFHEDSTMASIDLFNDNFTVPAEIDNLYFELNVPTSNVDYFDVYLDQDGLGSTYGYGAYPVARWGGGSVPGIYSGILYFSNFKGVNYLGQTIGLRFSLSYDVAQDRGLGSTLVLTSSPVPEPSTLLLLGFGFVALGLMLRKKGIKQA